MPKRKSELQEDRWLRKLKKYEQKLNSGKQKRNKVIIYSSDEDILLNEDTDILVEDNPPGMSTPGMSTPVIPISNEETVDIQEPVTNQEPVNNQVPNNNKDDIDIDLLRILGDFEPETVECGEDLLEDISKRFQHILMNGLKKECKEDLYKRYLLPKNVPLAKAPSLNPELATILSETFKNRDKLISSKQEQLGRALTAVGRAMSSLMLKKNDMQEVMRNLNDCSKLIADSHYAETYTRRSIIIPSVDKSIVEALKDRKRDAYLFGENLADMVKNSKSIKSTGNFIHGPSVTLNWRGPSSRARPARGYQLNRGGGLRTQYTRGRGYSQHPAPAPQRRAPPPRSYHPSQASQLAPPPPPRRPNSYTTTRRPPTQASR